MHKITCGLLLVCLGLVACQTEDTATAKEGTVKRVVFFPLERFIEEEAARLNQSALPLEKHVWYNEEEEIQSQTEVDYEKELSLFRRADINKPAWTDRYQADTVFQNELVREVRYRALDEELEVKSLQIKWDDAGAVSEINVRRVSSSTLASNEYDLSYRPQAGYSIKTLQQNRAADPIKIRIEGTFQEVE